MTRPRAADDFPAIRARMEELRRARADLRVDVGSDPSGVPHLLPECFGYLVRSVRKVRPTMLTAVVVGLALGIWLGGNATAQGVRLLPIPHPIGLLLIDDDDEHGQGRKYKNREHEQDHQGEDEDHGRGGRSSPRGSWHDQAPTPNYYYSPPPSSYTAPYMLYAPYRHYAPPPSSYTAPYRPNAPYRPYAPPVSAQPSARARSQPSAPASASANPNRSRDGSGSTAPSIQWVDPAPAR